MRKLTINEIVPELAQNLGLSVDQLRSKFSQKEMWEKWNELIRAGVKKLQKAHKGASFRKSI